MQLNAALKKDLFELVLQLGDDRLVLGHRTSEWCGHAPMLEEDIALANIALDLLGQAQAFLAYAAEIEEQGRDEDKLAYFRNADQYRNLLLVERPNGDFAETITRHYLFHSFAVLQLELLGKSSIEKLAAISLKSLKESSYHLRHVEQWFLRLGDGTAESHKRAQAALDQCWPYLAEFFEKDTASANLIKAGLIPDLIGIQDQYRTRLNQTIKQATLTLPSAAFLSPSGGRRGEHTEYLAPMLAEMQILPRTYPEAHW